MVCFRLPWVFSPTFVFLWRSYHGRGNKGEFQGFGPLLASTWCRDPRKETYFMSCGTASPKTGPTNLCETSPWMGNHTQNITHALQQLTDSLSEPGLKRGNLAIPDSPYKWSASPGAFNGSNIFRYAEFSLVGVSIRDLGSECTKIAHGHSLTTFTTDSGIRSDLHPQWQSVLPVLITEKIAVR